MTDSRAPDAPRPPLFTRAYLGVLALQAAFGGALAAFLLLPKFLAQELDADAKQIGGVMASFAFASVLAVPVVGVAVDRLGRRAFLLAGCALMLASSLGFLLVHQLGPALYALRALQGAAFACLYIAGSALVVDCAPPERLSQALAMFGATFHATNASVPWIVERASERFGWPPIFAGAAAASLLAALLALGLGERDPGRPAAPEPPAPGLLSILRRGAALRAAGVMMMVGVLIAAMTTYIQPYALELGISRIADFFVAFSATVLGVRVALGPWMDRLDRHRVCTLSAALYVGVLLATPGVTSARLPLLGAVLGLAHGIFIPCFNAMNLQRAGERERGKVMAVVSGSFNLGLAAGTYLLGLLAAAAGYAASFRAAAAGAGVALLLLLLFRGSARWSAAAGAGA